MLAHTELTEVARKEVTLNTSYFVVSKSFHCLVFDAVQKEPHLLFLVAGEVFFFINSRARVTETALFCGGTKCSAGTVYQIVIILLDWRAFV